MTRLANFLIIVTCAMLAIGFASANNQSKDGVPDRIIAVGDLHGDYDAYLSILSRAGLADKRGRWTGGETAFVQTGDIVDRGPDSLKIITHIRKLQKDAKKKGGKVVTLVGNHEAMNVIGDLRYVHPGEYEAFANRRSERLRASLFNANKTAIEAFYLEQDPTLSSQAIREKWEAATPLGKIEHQRAWAPDGEVGEWIVANPVVARIGANLFAHGGLSAEYSTFTIDEINRQAAADLLARAQELTASINDPLGPLWYRGLVQREEQTGETETATSAVRPTIEQEIEIVLNAFAAERMIIGHTPALKGVRTSQNGRIIQIDTGIANYYDGVGEYLEITGGKIMAHPIGGDGPSRVIAE
ncbi:MAG: metallophosphoesterase [Pseudomonadota bacterium]